MSTPTTAPTTEVVKAPRAEVAAFDPNDPVALYMNTGLFEQLQRVAALMSKANVVPEYLRGPEKLSDCFLVVSQAFRWGMDPFAVAQCTYVLKGKLGYEGKLIAAVVNVSGRLTAPLKPTYRGAGPDRIVTISGQFKQEAEPRTVEGSVRSWGTENKMWKDDPDQILFYRGAREWARRHMPEAVLGVQAEEEVDVATLVDVSPRSALPEPSSTAEMMEAAKERLRAGAPATGGVVVVDTVTKLDQEAMAKASLSVDMREPGSDDGDPAAATPPASHDCLHRSIHGRQGKIVVCNDCHRDVTAIELRNAEGRYAQAQGGK